jgi:hypothetical protein
VQVDGVASAYLTRGRQQIEIGPVPAGMWTLWVDFGDGPTRIGTMRVPRGEHIAVPCDAAARRCRLPGDEAVPDAPPDAGANNEEEVRTHQ